MCPAVPHARRLNGELRVPGDKSISHRALILGAIAEGHQTIADIAGAADVESTAACLRELGTTIERDDAGLMHVTAGSAPANARLDAGNSGTTARLLCGLTAGLGVPCIIDGDESLRRRPMKRVTDPLTSMGASITASASDALPVRVETARLNGIRYQLPVASAQVKSALLIAGLFARGETTVVEPVPTRDHTERMLSAMGVELRRSGRAVTVVGMQTPQGVHIAVPGDFSSAAFFLAAAAGLEGSKVTLPATGTNPTRTGLLEVLDAMGCQVERHNERDESGEPVADLEVNGGPLGAITIDDPARIASIIDEIPIIAVLATRAQGTTAIRGATELRHKESDRIQSIVKNLRALGADVAESEDGLSVTGPVQLRGGRVSSFGDHRMAMAMAVADLFSEGDVTIDDPSIVDVSYPAFFDDLRSLTNK